MRYYAILTAAMLSSALALETTPLNKCQLKGYRCAIQCNSPPEVDVTRNFACTSGNRCCKPIETVPEESPCDTAGYDCRDNCKGDEEDVSATSSCSVGGATPRLTVRSKKCCKPKVTVPEESPCDIAGYDCRDNCKGDEEDVSAITSCKVGGGVTRLSTVRSKKCCKPKVTVPEESPCEEAGYKCSSRCESDETDVSATTSCKVGVNTRFSIGVKKCCKPKVVTPKESPCEEAGYKCSSRCESDETDVSATTSCKVGVNTRFSVGVKKCCKPKVVTPKESPCEEAGYKCSSRCESDETDVSSTTSCKVGANTRFSAGAKKCCKPKRRIPPPPQKTPCENAGHKCSQYCASDEKDVSSTTSCKIGGFRSTKKCCKKAPVKVKSCEKAGNRCATKSCGFNEIVDDKNSCGLRSRLICCQVKPVVKTCATFGGSCQKTDCNKFTQKPVLGGTCPGKKYCCKPKKLTPPPPPPVTCRKAGGECQSTSCSRGQKSVVGTCTGSKQYCCQDKVNVPLWQ